jgi:hypothetical protein
MNHQATYQILYVTPGFLAWLNEDALVLVRRLVVVIKQDVLRIKALSVDRSL